MTSRVSFYKAMIQDLRHRIWMIALSCLASFMALPVFYLLQQQGWDRTINRWIENGYRDWSEVLIDKKEWVYDFFGAYILITCGIVLGAGALIVGIWGFRHVFSKKMIDLYHSVPIDRKQLFLVSYVNGFLIWFVPMLVGIGLTAVMSMVFLGNLTAWMGVVPVILKSVGCLVLAFLLIYHLAIVAVMLSGNILNTLVNGTIINFAVLALYGLFEVFAGTYFDTYYSFFERNILELLWTSPVCSAVYQLIMCYENWNMSVFIMNMVVAAVMFAAGFVLYLLRPSELAEQGMKIKWVQVVFKTIVTVAAGLAGWLFFGYLTDTDFLAWTVFGAVFAGVLIYGILDIIFHMDFKAFFKHKIQMAVTTLAAILVGCTFLFDWVGFDTYLPEQDNIASMGIYVTGFGMNGYNSYVYDGMLTVENRINRMEYENAERIYAFLETVTDRISGETFESPQEGKSGIATVRVTEKSGRSYYRSYRVWNVDEEVLVPILLDDSYVQQHMIIPDIMIEDIEILPLDSDYRIELRTGVTSQDILNEEHAKELIRAYNEDIAKQPELNVYQDVKLLGQIRFRHNGNQYFNIYMDIYEGMEHVTNVLKKYDYDFFLDEVEPQEVTSIRVLAYGDGNTSLADMFELNGANDNKQSDTGQIYDKIVVTEQISADVEIAQVVSTETQYSARFEDKEDIKKLLDVVVFMTPYNLTMFGEDYCSVEIQVNFKELQKNTNAYIEPGKMPAELLDQFEKGSQWY